MSLGGDRSKVLDEIMKDFYDLGIPIIAAAGNTDEDACNISPAHLDYVMTVGATDIQDRRAIFSNWGKCVDIFAPGIEIPSVSTNALEYVLKTGTSMAAPHVTGVVAQLLQRDPNWKPNQIYTELKRLSSPLVTDPKGSSTLLVRGIHGDTPTGSTPESGGSPQSTGTSSGISNLKVQNYWMFIVAVLLINLI